MLDSLQGQLEKLEGRIHRRAHLNRQYGSAKESLRETQKQRKAQEARVRRARAALAESGKTSIWITLKKMLGEKRPGPRRLRGELVEAQSQLQETNELLRALDAEAGLLHEDLKKLGNPEKEKIAVLHKLETAIRKRGGSRGADLGHIAASLGTADEELREIREAKVAGESALASLKRLCETLEEIRREQPRTAPGRPVDAIIAPPQNYRVAMQLPSRIHPKLQAFGRELADVRLAEKTDGFIRHFRGFGRRMSKLVVRDLKEMRIRGSLVYAENAVERVRRLLTFVSRRAEKVHKTRTALELRRRKILME